MLTKIEALELVSKELRRRDSVDNPSIVIDKHTIEKAFGWIFFFDSKKFVETGMLKYALVGNGPVVVDKFSGTVEFLGSYKPPDDIIKDYERKLAERPSQGTVEELLSQVDNIMTGTGREFQLWVPEHLTFRDQSVRSDVAMAIILDKILGKGYKPDGFAEAASGRTYKYKVFQIT